MSKSYTFRRSFSYLPQILIIAGIYYLAARVGLTLGFRETNASPVWPPTGIAFAALFLFGYKIWPGVFIGAFLANYSTGLSALVSFPIAIGNTLEAVAGLFLFKQITNDRSIFNGVRGTIAFLIPVSMVGTMISATIGTISVVSGGYSSGAPVHYVWWTWWLGDTVGSIVVAPLILSIASFSLKEWSSKTLTTFAILSVSALTTSLLIFGPWIRQGHILLYSTLALIVISAFHLPGFGVTFLAALISMIAVWGTTSGFGPFVLTGLNESLLFLQIYVGTIASTGLVLCAAVNERRKALQDLVASEHSASIIAAEKTLLLRELNHRVKNNLQIIISLLNMHEHSLETPESKNIFKECVERVIAISNIHQALFGPSQPDNVDLSKYLPLLAENLINMYRTNNNEVQIQIIADSISIDHEKAMPLGMILNELMVNSLKHAFRSEEQGMIRLNLKRVDSKLLLAYSDNGTGVSGQQQKSEGLSVGMQIMNLLVRQLSGTIQVRPSTTGIAYELEFPIRS
ncbi:MAG TPA: MASE1 domain-containing protein [Acidobacteriota bacterium]|nr:MASE1 domain-containing protein [Acidobacteriota bacterium]